MNTPHGAPHDIYGRMAQANRDRDGSLKASEKGSARWYQDLVDYYLRRRSEYADYWQQIEQQYNRGKDIARSRNRVGTREIQPGRVYSMVHNTEAQVVGMPPKFHFEGWTPAVEKTVVPSYERAVNNEWHEDRSIMRSIALASRDTSKTGWGPVLSSYIGPSSDGATTEGAKQRREQQAADPLGSVLIEDVQNQVASEASLGDAPEQLEDFEMDARVRTGTISTKRISPWHFIIDPDATCLEDANWVGRIIVKRLDAVKNDALLSNTGNLEASATETFDFYGSDAARSKWRTTAGGSNPYDLVELYEIFEKRLDGRWDLVVIARDHDEILRHEKAYYWVGCPYSLLRWNDDGEEIFAQPDVAVVQDEIDAECLLYTKSMDGYARDHEDTIFVDESAGISEEHWHAVTKPGVAKKIEVEVPQGKSLRDILMKLPRDAKSAEPLNFLGMLQNAIEMGTGRGPNQHMQPLRSGASATEAQIIERRSATASSHKNQAAEAFVLDVALKRLGLMVQFYDKERIVRLAGPEAAEAWQGGPDGTWTENDIHMGLRVTIERGSMRPRDDAQVFQDLMAIAQISAGNPILFGNTNWAEWQLEAYKALLGVAGENLLISTNTQEINDATKNLFAMQNNPAMQGGGSRPAQPGVASQPGGQGG
jgi:hypothetical protein